MCKEKCMSLFSLLNNHHCNQDNKHIHYSQKTNRDFPGGAVVKNPPANAGDTGSIPDPGRSHMPRSN